MINYTEVVVKSIWLRDAAKGGKLSRKEVRAEVIKLAKCSDWNARQMAAIIGWHRSTLQDMLRDVDRPYQSLQGGTVIAGALDLVLSLQGAVANKQEPPRSIIRATVKSGFSTRLLAHLTGIPLGTILYQQRKLREEEDDADSGR